MKTKKTTQSHNEAIPCFVLTFTIEEEQQIKQCFDELGYEFDIDGIKEFIMETTDQILKSDDLKNQKRANGIWQFAQDNPELVGKGISFVEGLVNRMRKPGT